MSKFWVFVFNLCGALGGIACILTWLGIKPQDLWGGHMSVALPHWLWLLFGLSLFAFSIGLSVYTLRKQTAWQPSGKPLWRKLEWCNQERARLEAEVKKWKELYDSKSVSKTEAFKHPPSEVVTGHKYVNEVVELDGKSFRQCSFMNTKLMYHGDAPTEILPPSVVDGLTILTTDNPAIALYAGLNNLITSAPGAEIRESEDGPTYRKVATGSKESLTASDPHIVVKVTENSEGVFPETVFTLSNVRGGVAHRIQLQPWRPEHGGSMSFRELPILEVGATSSLRPDIEGVGVLHKHDLLGIIKHEHESRLGTVAQSGDPLGPFPIPLTINYEDLSGKIIQTSFDLIFDPKASIRRTIHGSSGFAKGQEPIVLEAKNFEFRIVGKK